MRRIWMIGLLLLLSGVAAAQENYDWVSNLLPDADDPSALNKLLQQGSETVFVDELLLVNLFEFEDSWETLEAESNYLRIEGDEYRIYGSESGYVYWGQNATSYENIAVEVRTRQLSAEDNNGFGVLCRSSIDNIDYSGYEFFISGDGFYGIALVPRDDGEYLPLQAWERTDLINTGQNAENHVLAVCYQDYLALYINGQLATEIRDDTLTEGAVSLSATIYEEGADVLIAYDDMRIWSLDDTPPAIRNEDDRRSGDTLTETDSPPTTPDSGRNTVRGLLGGADSDDAPDTDDTDDSIGALLADSDIQPGDLVDQDNFDDPDIWADYSDEVSNETRVRDGVLWMQAGRGEGFVLWSLNTRLHNNAIVQMDTTYIGGTLNNGYGVICRGHPSYDGSGYYFFMADTGFARLSRSDEGTFTPLTDWERTSAIRVADENRLTAVCVDDYLALYINGEMILEAQDDTYNAGYSGAAAAHYEEGDELIQVEFDNLRIWEASAAATPAENDANNAETDDD